MPGLDGLRAIAVLAVIAYHLGFSWAPGGLLGVGMFFTLSGYLITDLLLAEQATDKVRLGRFWLARARRLLPALFLMLVLVMSWVTLIGPHQTTDFRTAAATAVLYVNNWWSIFHDVSYFQAFAAPGPLNHLWSLSIEEQFYVFWPSLLVLGFWLLPERPTSFAVRPRLAGATLGLAAVSLGLMVLLFEPGIDPSRVYYGTDTRSFELLVGAALAMVWPSRRLQGPLRHRARLTIDLAGVAGLIVIVAMIRWTSEFSPFLYRGGFLLLAVATAVVVAGLVHPAARLGSWVGCRPLRWLGQRSYGIYLWHFPVIVLTSPAQPGDVQPVRCLLQVAAVVGISALSWRFVEDPIRHGALSRAMRVAWGGHWRPGAMPAKGWVAAASSLAILSVAVAGAAGAGIRTPAQVPGKTTVAETFVAKPTRDESKHGNCDAVVHIGDSTSEGLASANYLPKPYQRINAQYARVGAKVQHLEISGARSIYERFNGLSNAHDVARAWKQRKYRGCWVLALGTNEAANVAAGSQFTFDQRIKSMMSVIGTAPVMWVNVRSLRTSGPYAQMNMQRWDDALVGACADYPNMRVYDWASDVRTEWFIPDGIHFTTPGYAARSRYIANALREAFPRSSASRPSTCVVGHGGAKARATVAAP